MFFTKEKKNPLNSPSLFQTLKKYTIEDAEKHYSALLELQCVQFVMKACAMFIRGHSKCLTFSCLCPSLSQGSGQRSLHKDIILYSYSACFDAAFGAQDMLLKDVLATPRNFCVSISLIILPTCG